MPNILCFEGMSLNLLLSFTELGAAVPLCQESSIRKNMMDDGLTL